jgi:hypothetical protein
VQLGHDARFEVGAARRRTGAFPARGDHWSRPDEKRRHQLALRLLVGRLGAVLLLVGSGQFAEALGFVGELFFQKVERGLLEQRLVERASLSLGGLEVAAEERLGQRGHPAGLPLEGVDVLALDLHGRRQVAGALPVQRDV